LKTINFKALQFSVLVSRELVQDYTYFVELNLTADDQSKVLSNLEEIGIFRKESVIPNLWYIVNPLIKI